MVRLKQGGVEEFKVVRFPFQFHNGSIKTGKKNERNTRKVKVSIPQWFD